MTSTDAAQAELARLAAIADYDVVGHAPDADLVALCSLAATVCDAGSAAVNLIDDAHQHQVAAWGIDAQVCSRADAMCTVTLESGGDVVLADAAGDPRFAHNPWVDGRLGTVRFYASHLLRTPGGHVVGTLCVFDEQPRTVDDDRRRGLETLARQVVDVLELRLQGRVLRDTLAELSRSHEQLSAFAGQLSHDLRTPLTAVIGFAELAAEQSSVSGDPVTAGYIDRCASGGRRMLATIDELLAFARVGGALHPRPVPLDAVMAAVRDDVGAEVAEASGAVVTWSGPDVVADPAQLRLLLQNLVGNALLHRRPDRAPTVAVRTSTRPDGQVELRVIDDGPGIPAERRADALTPLVRLNTVVHGTGLGLATCVRIVTAHGGTLTLGDTPGGGLTVTVSLPAS